MLVAALAALPAAFASPIELEPRGCTYGGPAQNFPPMSSWLPWTTVFGLYEQTMVNAGSSWDDVGRINVAISQAAASIGVDERVILAIILQESTGYVGVECTGNNDCGIMQCEGSSSIFNMNITRIFNINFYKILRLPFIPGPKWTVSGNLTFLAPCCMRSPILIFST